MSAATGGRLTTHVLDTASGKPASGLEVTLYRIEGERRVELKRVVTNADGRCDAPLLQGPDFAKGEYELVFAAGDYLLRFDTGGYLGPDGFYPEVTVTFTVGDDEHYHVPLLLSPYGYSTYRGS